MALPTSSISGSVNSANSVNRAISNSQTFGTEATSASRVSAAAANQQALDNWREAAAFNAEQARLQREWQEKMANTVYQRTVEDMRKAGINPVLAAGMGLGTASVSGGSAASIGSPESYMANTYADRVSSAESSGQSQSSGQSWGESGFATFLESMTTLISGLTGAMSSGLSVNVALNTLEDLTDRDENKDGQEDITDSISGIEKVINGTKSVGKWLLDEINPLNGPFFTTLKNNNRKFNELTKNKRK